MIIDVLIRLTTIRPWVVVHLLIYHLYLSIALEVGLCECGDDAYYRK